jgi:cell division protein FtsZ
MINLDFADVKTIMAGMGFAMMGTGVAEGPDRAVDAAKRAISSPLLEGASVTGARGVIINVTGGPDLSLVEVSEASSIVQEAADEDANIIFGAVVDPLLKGKVKITVIATGFGPPMSIKPSAGVQTPIDMTQYNDHARLRSDGDALGGGSGAFDRGTGTRLSIARRPLPDLPLTPAAPAEATTDLAAGGMPALPLAADSSRAPAVDNPVKLRLDEDGDGSALDVPAFLRRYEG